MHYAQLINSKNKCLFIYSAFIVFRVCGHGAQSFFLKLEFFG